MYEIPLYDSIQLWTTSHWYQHVLRSNRAGFDEQTTVDVDSWYRSLNIHISDNFQAGAFDNQICPFTVLIVSNDSDPMLW